MAGNCPELSFKESSGQDILIFIDWSLLIDFLGLKKFNKEILFVSWMNKLNKQTDLKGEHNFTNCFTFFVLGGPCHLSTFLPIGVQLVHSVMEKINISAFV